MDREAEESDVGTGEESKVELANSKFMAVVIHLFLAVAAILLVAATIAGLIVLRFYYLRDKTT
ncbi:hypothetical protein BH10ACI1_BH10ACI1_05530 [soil metagenome]